MFDVVIIGGGVAGLINANILADKGWRVCLMEKNQYPFHRVCGEYISNEVKPFLERINCYPLDLSPVSITKFQLSSPKGKSVKMQLDLGGFGISRFAFDAWLAEKARGNGAEIREDTKVTDVSYTGDSFEIQRDGSDSVKARQVIGAFGKRVALDRNLGREFFKKRSPYVGVKYHINTDFDNDTVALHNFEGGYCGLSRVEQGRFNLCYLSHRAPLKKLGSLSALENSILSKNPFLKEIFSNSNFLFKKPVVINEISFAPKEPVHEHILMTGDAAGMITPLCGNGMAMAIHSAKFATELIDLYLKGEISRETLETRYRQVWGRTFNERLWAGRQIQKLFGKTMVSNFAVSLVDQSKTVAKWIMRQTHGNEF